MPGLFTKVRFNGKRWNYYFREGTGKLVALDDKGNETSETLTEGLDETKMENIQVFEGEYVHSLREEAKKLREGSESFLKRLGLSKPEELDEYLKKVNDLAKNGGENEAATIKQLRDLLSDKDRQFDAERTDLRKQVEGWQTRFKSSLRDAALMGAVSVPDAVKPVEVKMLLEPFVAVDDEGNISVFEDMAHTRKRLAPNGQPMKVDDFAKWYYEQNPHHIRGAAGGAGSGGDKGGSGGKVDASLPPMERLKQARRAGAGK